MASEERPKSSWEVVRGPRALRRRALRSGPAHVTYERYLDVVCRAGTVFARPSPSTRHAVRRGRDLPNCKPAYRRSSTACFSGHVRRARRAKFVKLRSLGDFSGLEFHHFSGRRLHGSSRRHGAQGTQGYPDAPVDGLALAWNELFGRSPRRPAPDSRVTRRPPVSPSLVSHPRGLLKAPSDGVQCIKNAPFGRQQFIYFPRPPGCYSVV